MPVHAFSICLGSLSGAPSEANLGYVQIALVGAIVVGYTKFNASSLYFHIRLQVFDEDSSRHVPSA
jgi:hypothetical protein